jgi:N-acetylneuraminic acid mutarotase
MLQTGKRDPDWVCMTRFRLVARCLVLCFLAFSIASCNIANNPPVGKVTIAASAGTATCSGHPCGDMGVNVGLTASPPSTSSNPNITWTVKSGPGTITATAPGATTATFSSTTMGSSVIEAKDSSSGASGTVTVLTNANPTVNTTAITIVQFASTNVPLSAVGGSGTLTWALAGGTSLPSPLVLNTNGTVSGKTGAAAGSYSFQVTVTDQDSMVSPAATINLTVNLPPAPTILISPITPLPSALQGSRYSEKITASQGHSPYVLSTTPANPLTTLGLTDTISGGTMKIAGTATAPVGTTAAFTLTVMDSSNPPQTSTFNLSIEVSLPAAGFTTTGSMASARQLHTATLLNTGDVLVVGGVDNSKNTLASAELYDPTAATFAATGSLVTARSEHTATLLNTGEVLVAGGLDGNGNALASAELYDPTNGTFTATGSLITARSGQTATLLNDGTVLITGGLGTNGHGLPLASAEIYDPTSGTFAATAGAMTTARSAHAATLLSDGTILISGGLDSNKQPLASAEIYDPATGTFTATSGSMATARSGHTATLLDDGTVLVVGGVDKSGTALASAEIFNPTTGSFAATGSLTTARAEHTATLLSDGTVVVIGGASFLSIGCGSNCVNIVPIAIVTAERFDLVTGTFTPTTGSLNTAREEHTATLLSDGSVLVTGGVNSLLNGNVFVSTVLSSAELFK